jgi:hypothetical protein
MFIPIVLCWDYVRPLSMQVTFDGYLASHICAVGMADPKSLRLLLNLTHSFNGQIGRVTIVTRPSTSM